MAQNHNLPRMNLMEKYVLENIILFFPDVEITLRELRNPTPEAVSKFYVSFLQELGADIDNLRQIQNNQMPLIAHVDMYNATVPILNLYQCINYFLKGIGIDMFSVSDLAMPTAKRTLYFFDALLRFLSHCDDRIEKLQPELEKLRDMKLHQKELLSKIEVLRNDINHRALARGQRRDKIREVDKSIGMEKEKLDGLMNEKEEHLSAQNSIKKLKEEDAEKENQLVRTIKKIEDDVTELKGMIVKSPQKLTHQVDEQTQKRDELLQNVKNLKSQIEEKKRLTQTISKHQLKQEERYQKVRDLFEIKLNIKNKEQEKLDLLDRYAKIVELCYEIELRISSQEERRKMLSENVVEHRQRKENRKMEEIEQLETAKRKLEMFINNREERVKHLDGIQKEKNEIDEDIKQIERQFSEYKTREQAIRSKSKLAEEELILKYKKIMLKMKALNGNLRH